MTTTNLSKEYLEHPTSLKAFRNVTLLVGCYCIISLLTLVTIAVLRHHAKLVNDTVWIRGIILACTSLLLFVFATRLTRGSFRAYVRVRILSAILLASVIVMLAIPGILPLWMKIEQATCGLFLLGVTIIINGKHLRSLFASR